MRTGRPVGVTTLPGPMPVHLAERHEQRAPGAEADDLGGDGRAAAAGGDVADLADLGLEPRRLDDEPDQVADAAAAAVQVGAADGDAAAERQARRSARPPARSSVASKLLLHHFARAAELRLERRVDLALAGADDRAAAGDAAVGLHAEVLDAAELGDEAVGVLAQDVEVVGVDEDEHAVALDEPAQRAADGVDDALGLDGDRAPGRSARRCAGRARPRRARRARRSRRAARPSSAAAACSAAAAGSTAARASAAPAV